MTDDSDATTDVPPSGSRLVRALGFWAIIAVVCVLLALFTLPATRRAGPAAYRNQCQNQMRQLALALLNYHSAWNAFPPATTVDENGKPLHSWRTLVLPFTEETRLYESIDLSKPWDDPVNAAAYETAIGPLQCHSSDIPPGYTTYLAVVTPNSCLRATESRSLSQITDDPAETILIIEVDAEHAVHWMAPQDADEELLLRIGSSSNLSHKGGMHAGFADGRARFVPADTASSTLRSWASVSGP